MIWTRDEYQLYDERDVVDIDQVYALLQQTYWAGNRPREKMEKLIAHTTCFSLFRGDELVAFVRVLSDFAAVSWVADMVVKDAYRGLGLGGWMMECVVSHPDFAQTQFILQTKDAHSFYEKLGFERRDSLMSTSVSYLG